MGQRILRARYGVSGGVAAASYSTTFPATENPISQGGAWVRGLQEGLNWTDPQTTGGSPGVAFSNLTSMTQPPYNDSIAHLKNWADANQQITAVIHNSGGFSGFSLEIELLLRFQMGARNARGYEVDFVFGNGTCSLVRWNGPGGTDGTGAGVAFDSMATTTTNVDFSDGNVVVASIVGPLINVTCNGNPIYTNFDVQAWAVANGGNYWNTGAPGMGFVNETGGQNSGLGWKSWTAQAR